MTAASKARTFFQRKDVIEQISASVPKTLKPERIARLALTACLTNNDLLECFVTPAGQQSIVLAILKAGALGIEIDGRNGYLVPFRDREKGMLAQFLPGYQGMIQMAYNHPSVSDIWADTVRDGDEFVWVGGLERRLEHKRAESDKRGELKYAYAVCRMRTGNTTFVVLDKADVTRAKRSSKSASSNYSPWVQHEDSMWVKTAIKQLCKMIPQSSELQSMLDVDEEDYNPKPIEAVALPKFEPGDALLAPTPTAAPAVVEAFPASSSPSEFPVSGDPIPMGTVEPAKVDPEKPKKAAPKPAAAPVPAVANSAPAAAAPAPAVSPAPPVSEMTGSPSDPTDADPTKDIYGRIKRDGVTEGAVLALMVRLKLIAPTVEQLVDVPEVKIRQVLTRWSTHLRTMREVSQ